MLGDILYGTGTLTHGGLLFTARGSGLRGAGVSLELLIGTPLAVVVTPTGLGTGTIRVTAPSGITEAQLITALKAAPYFKALARVEQATGDGTADVALPLAKTFFGVAGGLQQWLESRLGIQGWDDRDMLATGRPVGLIMPFTGTLDRIHYESDGYDYFKGDVIIGIAFQLDRAFHEQNAVLDMFRRALWVAIKTFTHPDLIDKGDVEWSYTNVLKEEVIGTILEEARLKVTVTAPLMWQELSFEPEDAAPAEEMALLQIGLFREPLDDPLGPLADGSPGREDLDQIINVPLT